MQQTGAIDDHELLRAFATDNDEAAFARLVDNHARWLFAAAFRQLRNHHQAEDAVQVVFAVLARRAHTMNSRQKISGWLFTTLQYTVANLRRADRSRQKHESEFARSSPQPVEIDQALARECAAQLDAAVARLADPFRSAILLRFYQQMPFDQVAHSLGTTEATARKRVERGILGLRKLLGAGPNAETLLSATAAIGLDQFPTGLSHTVAHSALAAKATSAISPVAKAVGYLLTLAKLQIALIVGAVVTVPVAVVTLHVNRPSTNIVLADAAPTTEPTTTTIGGTVRDEAGNGLAGTAVHLEWVDSTTTQRRMRRVDVKTDTKGHWEYGPVHIEKLEQLRVQLTHAGLVKEEEAAAHGGKLADQSAEFVMVKGIEISGTVTDESENPIPGASVSTIRTWYVSNDSGTTVKADALGHFSLPPRKPGAISLTITAKGYAPELQRVDAATGMPLVQVILSPGKTLRARVVDADGKPIQGAAVQTRRWRGMESLKWEGKTDRDGKFTMSDAPPDAIEFEISKAGYQSLIGQKDASLTASDKEIALTMRAQPTFRGTVTDAQTGQPISNFRVITGWVFWDGDPPFYLFDSAKKFTNGNYKVTMDGHSEVLEYYVRVEADGYTPAISLPMTASATCDLKLQRGENVKGHVVDADGNPVAGAQVLLALPGSQINLMDGKLPRADEEQLTKTDADGRFEFPPQVGRFHLLVLGDGGYALSILDKQPGESIEMKLLPWTRVEGIYPAGDSAPELSNLQVWINQIKASRDVDVNYEWNFMLKPDSAGKFVVEKMPGFEGKPIELGMSQNVFNGPSDRRWIPMRLATGQSVKVDLSGVTVSGRAEKPGAGSVTGSSRFFLKPLMEGSAQSWPTDWSEQPELPRPYYVEDFHGPGSFQISGIRPGKYVYEVEIDAESPLEAWGIVDVPRGKERFDLGEIVCQPAVPLKVGDSLPAALGYRLDGTAIRAADFSGKYVVLAMWGSDVGGMNGVLTELGKQLNGDPRVVLLGLNQDAVEDDVVTRPGQLGIGGWTDGYMGQLDGMLNSALWGKNRPAIYIAGPDGKMLAVDVPMKEAAATVQKILPGKMVH